MNLLDILHFLYFTFFTYPFLRYFPPSPALSCFHHCPLWLIHTQLKLFPHPSLPFTLLIFNFFSRTLSFATPLPSPCPALSCFHHHLLCLNHTQLNLFPHPSVPFTYFFFLLFSFTLSFAMAPHPPSPALPCLALPSSLLALQPINSP